MILYGCSKQQTTRNEVRKKSLVAGTDQSHGLGTETNLTTVPLRNLLLDSMNPRANWQRNSRHIQVKAVLSQEMPCKAQLEEKVVGLKHLAWHETCQ